MTLDDSITTSGTPGDSLRIRNITITNWRHLNNINLQLDVDEGLVCIVGANGTGKSHLLELIASCAYRLGLAQGIDIPRGEVFADTHELSLEFFLAHGVSDAVDQEVQKHAVLAAWDRTLTIRSKKDSVGSSFIVEGGGLSEAAHRTSIAEIVIKQLQLSKSVHFLSLDADRAYPKKNVNVNEIAQAYEIDWTGSEYMRGRSFRTSTTLYDEWLKYFLV